MKFKWKPPFILPSYLKRFHVLNPDCFFDSNDAFENACMEFDEVNLKPTYKILWGVPGFHLAMSNIVCFFKLIVRMIFYYWIIYIYICTIGRSNAINIADRLGLPRVVVEMARELYGAASAEIDEVTCQYKKQYFK